VLAGVTLPSRLSLSPAEGAPAIARHGGAETSGRSSAAATCIYTRHDGSVSFRLQPLRCDELLVNHQHGTYGDNRQVLSEHIIRDLTPADHVDPWWPSFRCRRSLHTYLPQASAC